MSYVSHLRGTMSGAVYPADQLMNLDPVDGRPVEIIFDLERLKAEQPDFAWYHPERKDLWRFGALLPLDIANPDDARHIVTLGEGHTPLREYSVHRVAQAHRFRLQIKDEGKAVPGWGANPTQSFKDRGMCMSASMAKRFGLTKLVVPTQGNAGDSLMQYAMTAGMAVTVIMPDDTPMPILGRVAAMAAQRDDVTLRLVKGTIREAGALMREEYLPHGWFNVATFQEPGWRIDGKKTLGLELAEPRERGAPWEVPDVVVYPTGGGTGVLGMWKAWNELEALGVIGSKRPRMICVQSEVTTPLVRAFDDGSADTTALPPSGFTTCTGLNVPGGVGHFKVLDIIRQSGGMAIAIPEAETDAALRDIWQATHWWIAPEGAACLAALPRLVDHGMIRPGDRVVAVNTGSLEKYLPDIRHLLVP